MSELLEASARRGDSPQKIKQKLAAVLAKDGEQQRRIYRLFDQYREKHSLGLLRKKKEVQPASIVKIWWDRNKIALLLLGLSLISMSAAAYLYTVSNLIYVEADSFAPSVNDISGEVFMEENSLIKDYSFARDSVVQTIWDWGDGSKRDTAKTASHRYDDLDRSYKITYTVLTARGKKSDGSRRVNFNPTCIATINSQIKNYELTASANFFLPVKIYDSFGPNEELEKQADSIRNLMSYSWDLGNGEIIEKDSIIYRYPSVESSYVVKLISRQFDPKHPDVLLCSHIDSIIIDLPRVVDLPLVPVNKLEIKAPDVSDLRQEEDYGLYFLLSLIALALYGLYELIIWSNRRAVLDESAEKLPPLRQKLKIELPDLNLFGNDHFASVATQLRARRVSGIKSLDLAKTLSRSIQAGGEFPLFSYKDQLQASQYLVLIDESSPKDHLARFYHAMLSELNKRDITAEFYFYDKDPSLCWKRRSQAVTQISWSQLGATFAGYRLIIIGTGEGLLDPLTGELSEFVLAQEGWAEKALLSTLPNEDWGRAEERLSQYFNFLPATEEGWEEMVPGWAKEEKPRPFDWKLKAFEVSPPEENSEKLIEELKLYLGESRFQWLCACAVYPVLYFELTLQLGEMITSNEIGLEALGHLFRLEWFRKGRIPDDIRLQLIDQLEERHAKETRNLISQILKENPAPENSLAKQDQDLTLAIYQYLNSSKSLEDKARLQQALKDLRPEDLEDIISLKYLSDVKHNPMLIPLPRSLYRGGIGLMGTQWLSRLGIVLGTILLFLGIVSMQDLGRLVNEEEHVYLAKDLHLDSREDSARYYHYQAVQQTIKQNELASQDGISLLAEMNYKRAFDKGILETNRADSFVNNFWQHRYKWARINYQSRHNEEAQELLLGLPDRVLADSLKNPQSVALAKNRSLDPRALTRKIKQDFPDLSDSTPNGISYLKGLVYLEFTEVENDAFVQRTLADSVIRNLNSLAAEFFQSLPQSDLELLRQKLARVPLISNNKAYASLAEKLGRYEYRLNVTTGRLDGGNTDEIPIMLSLIGEKGNIDVRLDSSTNANFQFEKAWRDSWTLYSFIPLGEIKEIQFRLGIAGKPGIDDWLIEDLQLATPDGFGPYDIPVNHWIGDYAGRSQSLSIYPGTALEVDPTLHAERDTTAEEPPAITVLRGVVVDKDQNRISAIEVRETLTNSFTETSFYGEFELPVRLQRANAVRLQLSNKFEVFAGKERFLPGTLELDTLIYVDSIGAEELILTLNEIELEQNIEQQQIGKSSFVKPAMVYVQGGTFMIGQKDKEPGHEVTLSNFEIGKYEVTFEEYDLFCDATRREKPLDEGWGRRRRPVINVSWEDAVEYANWLSFQAGYEQVYEKVGIETNKGEAEAWRINYNANGYRLPTESEWEFAARGGLKAQNTLYSGSNELDSVAWYSANSKRQTQIIGQKVANELGIYDMSGNVWEWCNDWYGDLNADSQNNPQGPLTGRTRVMRGGSWADSNSYCRLSYRLSSFPDNRAKASDNGFRLSRRLP
ncbi:MAG: SUMF1/EgtB/PvdO family nonheme iron enzyme [Bacteroidia bacterium]|nr:SUMF1/EgtB/PvdO family nonheme iron enzyme [Bacteroidia bacterium]